MAKTLQQYVKYTVKELDLYTQKESSCVLKINTNLHLSLGPFVLADFKHVLQSQLLREKVGYYDVHLDGIIIDIKKIKVLGNTGAMRHDDPRIHVNLNADCYVFRPVAGAELSGIVKHIGAHHLGVIIHRVFNARINLTTKFSEEDVALNKEVSFRIKDYNLQTMFPFIEGDLISNSKAKSSPKKNKITKFKLEPNDTTDSGIEEKEIIELDELISLIKDEKVSDADSTPSKAKSGKSTKRKRNVTEPSEETPAIVKKEIKKEKKRKSKNNISLDVEDS